MKHNKKRMIHKMALAALMVSAIGAPSLVANAASAEGIQKQISMVTAKLDMKATLQDPVALAKQYAPDTVRAWEELLAQYKAALAEKSQEMTVNIEAVEAFKTTTLNTGDAIELTEWKTTNISSFDIAKWSDAKKINLAANGTSASTALKTIDLNVFDASKSGAIKAVELTALDADKERKLKVDGEELVTKVSSADDSLAPALATLEGDANDISISIKAVMTNADSVSSPLIQGQVELSEAVEAKDSRAIKEALTKLFHIYEDMIEQLQK